MSSLLRSLAPLRPSSKAFVRPAIAHFHSSTIRCAMSEAERDGHADQPGRAEKIEHHKSDSVSKAKTGKGEWKPELASQSEQSVQGEKSNMSMKEMQELGEKKAQEGKKPSGTT